MNLSREVTMIVLEKLIKDFSESTDKNYKIKKLAEIMCFQFHLKGFEK